MSSLEEETKNLIKELGVEEFTPMARGEEGPKKKPKASRKDKRERKKKEKKEEKKEEPPKPPRRADKPARNTFSRHQQETIPEAPVSFNWDRQTLYYPQDYGDRAPWWKHYTSDPPPEPLFKIASQTQAAKTTKLHAELGRMYRNEVKRFIEQQRAQGTDFAAVYATSRRNLDNLTFSDQIGHLVVLIQASPFHALLPLTQLIELAIKVRPREESANQHFEGKEEEEFEVTWRARRTMMEEVVNVFVEVLRTQRLLPPHRALRSFSTLVSTPSYQHVMDEANENPLSLLLRYFEGELQRLVSIVSNEILIPSAREDSVPHFMKVCLSGLASIVSCSPLEEVDLSVMNTTRPSRPLPKSTKNKVKKFDDSDDEDEDEEESKMSKKLGASSFGMDGNTSIIKVAYPEHLAVLVDKVGSPNSEISHHTRMLLLVQVLKKRVVKGRRRRRNKKEAEELRRMQGQEDQEEGDDFEEEEEEEEEDEAILRSKRDLVPLVLAIIKETEKKTSLETTTLSSQLHFINFLASLPMRGLFKVHLANKRRRDGRLAGTEAFKDIIDSLFSIYSPLLARLTTPSPKEDEEGDKKKGYKPLNWADMLFLSEVQKQQKRKEGLRRVEKKEKRKKRRLLEQMTEEEAEKALEEARKDASSNTNSSIYAQVTPASVSNLLSHLLRAINACVSLWYDFVEGRETGATTTSWADLVSPHLASLFQLVHIAPSFKTLVQTLSLLKQLCLPTKGGDKQGKKGSSKQLSPLANDELKSRYYKVLYASLSSPFLTTEKPSSSSFALLLNLLYSSIIVDTKSLRICSFLARLTLVLQHAQPTVSASLAYIFLMYNMVLELRNAGRGGFLLNPGMEGEVARSKKQKRQLKNKQETKHRSFLKDVVFDETCRDPLFASYFEKDTSNKSNSSSNDQKKAILEKRSGIKNAILYPLITLGYSHYHRSVRLFSQALLIHLFPSLEYNRDFRRRFHEPFLLNKHFSVNDTSYDERHKEEEDGNEERGKKKQRKRKQKLNEQGEEMIQTINLSHQHYLSDPFEDFNVLKELVTLKTTKKIRRRDLKMILALSGEQGTNMLNAEEEEEGKEEMVSKKKRKKRSEDEETSFSHIGFGKNPFVAMDDEMVQKIWREKTEGVSFQGRRMESDSDDDEYDMEGGDDDMDFTDMLEAQDGEDDYGDHDGGEEYDDDDDDDDDYDEEKEKDAFADELIDQMMRSKADGLGSEDEDDMDWV